MTRARFDGLLLFLLGSVLFIWLGLEWERSSSVSMVDFKHVYYGTQCMLALNAVLLLVTFTPRTTGGRLCSWTRLRSRRGLAISSLSIISGRRTGARFELQYLNSVEYA